MINQSTTRSFVPALGYHWLTPLYDVVVANTTRERTFKKALIHQADIGADQHVLDLACGTGTLAVDMSGQRQEAVIVGIDGDPAMLSRAVDKATIADSKVSFVSAFSTALPFSDASFDRVVSSLFFHHLSTDEKRSTFREVFRVLRPGGQLHIADWGAATGPVMRALF